MSLLHFIIPYIILFFFSLTKISCQETCSSIQCDVDQPKISFPFGIKELQKDKQCGYPGFNLECNYYTKETLLKLPSTLGKLYVKDINYTKKEIRLYGGTYGCLPQRYMESGGIDISPFRGFASHTYRFYDCPLSIKSDSTASETLAFYAFAATCITAFWDAFVTPYSSTDPTQVRVNQFLIDYGCLLKASVSVPIPSRIVSNDSSLSKKQNVSIYSYNLVTDDLYLTWTDPPKNENQPNFETGNNNPKGSPGTSGTPINNGNGFYLGGKPICETAQCSQAGNEPEIDYPFVINDDHKNVGCGYPGFNLTCNILDKTVLKLPQSGEYLVRKIDYTNKEIRLYDENNCLARRLQQQSLNVNLFPFKAYAYQTYNFFNCSRSIASNASALPVTKIPCLSNQNITVLMTVSSSSTTSRDEDSNNVTTVLIHRGCQILAPVTIPIPFSAITKVSSYDFTTDDIYLTWSAPNDGRKIGENNNWKKILGITTSVLAFLVAP